MLRFIFLLLGMTVINLSCTQNSGQNTNRQALKQKVEDYRDSLKNAKNPEKAQEYARKVANVAGKYTDQYPKDTMTPAYLYLLGDLHFRSLQNHQTALDYLKELRENYPDHKKAPSALFIQGFFYEQLDKTQKARHKYKEFIENYPDHTFTDDAKLSLKNLGKSAEEQLEEALEKRAKRDSLNQ